MRNSQKTDQTPPMDVLTFEKIFCSLVIFINFVGYRSWNRNRI